MPNPTEQIKNRIWGRKQPNAEDSIIELHHAMMRKYGWIPLEEFRQLPLPTLWHLSDCIREEMEAEQKELEKVKRKK